jgi:hypothetical protein
MLVVETIANIRRAYFVHGQLIKAIRRDLGVSRKVLRRSSDRRRMNRSSYPPPQVTDHRLADCSRVSLVVAHRTRMLPLSGRTCRENYLLPKSFR